MNSCKCGCGKETTRNYAPGHDQKLRTAIERQVGGLPALDALMAKIQAYRRKEIPLGELGDYIRAMNA